MEALREWLIVITENTIIVIDWMALIVVLIGTIEAFVRAFGVAFTGASNSARREVWLRYAHWLVAALTFQLAADIIETSITTDWASLGRIAVVALIRTFLNYFLDRDVAEVREVQHDRRLEQEREGAK